MAKADIGAQIKKRMAAAQQVSELETGDEAYQRIFRLPYKPSAARTCNLPISKLVSFYTADIGFKPDSPEKLQAFSEHLKENGLMVRIIVRPIPGTDTFEILAGHNRTAAAKLAGWTEIEAEIVEADDAKAITIATSTNLLQRQDLSIIERGKAYKALLNAEAKQGYRSDLEQPTSGEIRQKFSARALVAEFFGVTEYEIRKAIKLTELIPELQGILENEPKHLKLACADQIAEYDAETQKAFACLCSADGPRLNMAAMKHILQVSPPPHADSHEIISAWEEACRQTEQQAAFPKRITFDRKKLEPYLDRIGTQQELESLFLAFLNERFGKQ